MNTELQKPKNRGSSTWLRPRELFEDFEGMLGRLIPNGQEHWFLGSAVPSLDISETTSMVEAKLDVPGVKPNEIDVQIHGNTVTVRGERNEETEEKGKTYHRVERRCGSFARTFTLPCPVEEDEVAAEYRDGVLTITMPKTESAKAHRIEVKG
jgi:HSP20 family protein